MLFFGAEEFVVIGEAVAAGAINAVQFHLVLIGGACHEALDLGCAHMLNVHEVHVVGNHGADFINGVVGVFESMQYGVRHFCADAIMAVKADAVFCLIVAVGGGFADVVQQHGEGEFG